MEQLTQKDLLEFHTSLNSKKELIKRTSSCIIWYTFLYWMLADFSHEVIF